MPFRYGVMNDEERRKKEKEKEQNRYLRGPIFRLRQRLVGLCE